MSISSGKHDKRNSWLNHQEDLLLVFLIVVLLIPIWIFPYFPSQDGPGHLENAYIMRFYHQAGNTAFQKYYTFNSIITPTWFDHFLLVILISIMPTMLAEKIFLSGYVILFPLSVRYAINNINKSNIFLVLLSLPFIYNFCLYKGNYSFCYSLAIYFIVMGYWLKYQKEFNFKKILLFSSLLLLLYFFHVISFLMAALAIWLIIIFKSVFNETQNKSSRSFFQKGNFWRRLREIAFPQVYAFFPAIILFLLFIIGVQTVDSPIPMKWDVLAISEIKRRLMHFCSLYSLVSFDIKEIILSAALAAILGLLSINFLIKKFYLLPDSSTGFLIVFAAYCVIYFIAPQAILSGSRIVERLMFFPFFILLLWLSTNKYEIIVRRIIIILSTIITLSYLIICLPKYAELNDYIKEYLSGSPLIEHNNTLLPLSFSSQGFDEQGRYLSKRIRVFLHASGYLSIDKQLVNFDNYEALNKHFPIIFRPEFDPHKYLGEIGTEPPNVDIIKYSRCTGGEIDYVLIWGVSEDLRNNETTKFIFSQLAKEYDLIYTSPKRSLMQLYRRRNHMGDNKGP